jgi:LysR family transcriptional activator of glutamate synthase operon
MELLQLRYFLTVAKLLNISRAAEYHRIPQPAMSQTISRLEKELGTTLFDRHKNKLSLTQKGQEFLQSVSISISELDAVTQNINSDGPLRGELTLLVLNHRDTLVDCIIAFRKLYPDVSFRIFHDQGRSEPDAYDMCIACTPPDENYTQGKRLITERLQLLVAAGHPLAKKEQVDFAQLKEESFALLNKNNSLWQHTEHLCRQSGYAPKISMVCEDLHCMVKYVAAGMAVTLGPEVSWRSVKNDAVVFVPTEPEAHRHTYVFQSKRKRNEQLRQVFVDFMTAFFADRETEK